jgi:hypothetical protein
VNLSLLPARERDRFFKDAAEEIEVSCPGPFREIVAALLLRKQELFPADRRMIVEYEVTESEGSYHLMVASAS